MGRLVVFYTLFLPLWALLWFRFIVIYGLNLIIGCLGVVVGLLFGVLVVLRSTSILEGKGEIRVTLRTLAWLLFAVIAMISIGIYLILSLGLEAGIYMLNFAYPELVTSYVIVIVLFLKWEKKHKMLIMWDGLLRTRVYVVSKRAKG